jgi:ribosomal protein L22
LVDLQAAKTWMLAEVQAELTKMVDNVKRSLMVELKPELIKPMEDIRRNLVSELKSELSKPMEDFKRALKVEVPVKKDKPVLNAKKVPFKTQDTIIRLDQLADVLQNHGLNVTTGEVLEVLVEDGYLNKRFRPTSKGAIYIVEHQKRMGDVGGTEKSFYDMSAIELIPTVNFEGQLYFIQYFHKLLNQKPNLTLVR